MGTFKVSNEGSFVCDKFAVTLEPIIDLSLRSFLMTEAPNIEMLIDSLPNPNHFVDPRSANRPHFQVRGYEANSFVLKCPNNKTIVTEKRRSKFHYYS